MNLGQYNSRHVIKHVTLKLEINLARLPFYFQPVAKFMGKLRRNIRSTSA